MNIARIRLTAAQRALGINIDELLNSITLRVIFIVTYRKDGGASRVAKEGTLTRGEQKIQVLLPNGIQTNLGTEMRV